MITSVISEFPQHRSRTARLLSALGVAAFLGLVACGQTVQTQAISDPNEKQNRAVHDFNIAVDKNVIRPIASSATKIVPPEVQQSVVNLADNLELPGRVLNNVLQLRLDKAVENTVRFVLNTTLGVGGLFDIATPAGVPGKPTDFGETLHVWGVAEGNYVELPLLGPSTDRDALGKVVDYAMNPLKALLPPKSQLPLYATIGARVAERGRYSEIVDSILYDSADSYAQTRLFYLDKRRFNLGQAPADSSFEDPYAQ